jgi:hypothetical protein
VDEPKVVDYQGIVNTLEASIKGGDLKVSPWLSWSMAPPCALLYVMSAFMWFNLCNAHPHACASIVQGKVLFSTQPTKLDGWKVWAPLDDIVMGGVSDSSIRLEPGKGEEGSGARIAAVFSGKVSTGSVAVCVYVMREAGHQELAAYPAAPLHAWRVYDDSPCGNAYGRGLPSVSRL